MGNRYIVVVDPYSAEQLLAERLRSHGYTLLALHSQKPIPAGLAPNFHPELFQADFYWSGEVLDQLRAYHPEAVIAGDDTGVPLADQVSEALHVTSNGSHLSAVRNSKFAVQEFLRGRELRVLQQVRVQSEEELNHALAAWKIFPAVIKPASSGGSDSVSLVHSAAEIRAAATALLSQDNAMGIHNNAVLLQEYVTGTEYAVDMVTLAGKHHVAAICRYDKRAANGASFVYFAADIISPSDSNDPNVPRILDYAVKLLNALEVKVGPSHIEIKIDESGPVLIETHGRMHGGVAPRIFTRTYEPDLLTLTESAYVTPEDEPKYPSQAKLIAFGRIVFIVSEQSGEFAGYAEPVLEQLGSLPSFMQLLQLSKPGDTLHPTVDLWTCPTIVILVNASKPQLEQDTAQARLWLKPVAV